MKTLATNEAVRMMAVLLALIGTKAWLKGYEGVVSPAKWPGGDVRVWSDQLVDTLSNRGLNKEAREALTAGYYEGLLNEGSRLSGMNRLVTDNRAPTFEIRSQPDRRESGDFLFYELVPNSDVPDYEDGRAKYRLKTNSAGFADREYSLSKPPEVRRIAIMGDSVTRGQGAPFGGTYEALLEERLNEAHSSTTVQGYEILNFAVGSYNLTQQLGMAVERASKYSPDVYVLGLSPLSVYRSWGQHLALLVNAGRDLKYDYLRQLVRDADLKPGDSVGVADAKLARFRLPTIKWALAEMARFAAEREAGLAVVLVPDGSAPASLAEDFLGVREILNELRIPTIDLLDTFSGKADMLPFTVSATDRHPNAAGHQLMFERFYSRLSDDPALAEALVGPGNWSPTAVPRR